MEYFRAPRTVISLAVGIAVVLRPLVAVLVHQFERIASAGIEFVEESLAGVLQGVPQLGLVSAIPHEMLLLGLGVAAVVPLRVVEERRGCKLPYLALQGHGTCLGPVAGVHSGVVHRPRQHGNGIVEQPHHEVDCLLHRGPRQTVGGVVPAEGALDDGHAAIELERIEILGRYQALGLSDVLPLLVFAHVRHAVDVLDENPTVADGFESVIVAVVEEHTALIRAVGVERAGVVGHAAALVGEVAQIAVGHAVELRGVGVISEREAVHAAVRQAIVLERIDAGQILLGVFGFAEHRVNGNVAAGRLLQEAVTELEFVGAGRGREQQGPGRSGHQTFME